MMRCFATGYRHFQGENDEFDEAATATVTVTLRTTGEKRTVRVKPGQCEQLQYAIIP